MTYREFPPSAALRPLIERFWVLETDAVGDAIDPILPDGHPEIIVHCGEPFAEIGPDGRRRVQARTLFAGQLRRAIPVAPRGQARVVGARLQPHAGSLFVPGSQHELVDRVTDLKALQPDLARALRPPATLRRRASDDVAELARVLEAHAAGRQPDATVGRAIARALGARGLVRVSTMAVAAQSNARQLERLFRRHVGLSPKLWLRILRFQEVLRTVREGGSPRWAEVAQRHGFYDQAHFVRDFKAFTGQPPSAWNVTNESLTAIFSAVRRKPRLEDET